jgi:hypothetical protein
MNIQVLFNKSLKLPFIIFIVLLGISIYFGLEIRSSTINYIETFEPLENALEHKRVDIYSDAILVYRYYGTDTIEDLLKIEEEILISDNTCTKIDATLATYYNQKILDDKLYNSYSSSIVSHQKAEDIKDELLKLHRISLDNNQTNVNQSLFQEYENHIIIALNDIEKELLSIEIQKEKAQMTLRKTEVITITIISLGTILFIFFTTRHILFVRKNIVNPLDNISKQTNTIIENKEYIKNSKENINELQEKIESIVSFVEKETTQNPQKKKEFREHILKTEYHEIITFLKSRETQSRATTMKDIKVNLRMTHPTLMSRLKYLEDHSYIEITKHGRDKIISLLN